MVMVVYNGEKKTKFSRQKERAEITGDEAAFNARRIASLVASFNLL